MKENNLILASGSPRRRELLSLYTTDFTVCVSDFDESAVTAPTPAQLVEQLAIGKCLAVAKQHPDAVVIGCDTVVDVDGTVFGKPRDAEDAKRMLRALSGKTHQVHTGVCIAKEDRAEHFVDSCKVTFFPLGEEEIAFYTATPEPYDKASSTSTVTTNFGSSAGANPVNHACVSFPVSNSADPVFPATE